MTVQPPFAYYGGKTRMAEAIAELLPAHEHYVEPFAGSLAVFLAKRPAPLETLNDLDRDLVTFWRVLRDRPDDLFTMCALTPHSRAELVDVRRRDDDPDDLELARRVWAQLAQGRTGKLLNTGWRYRTGPNAGSLPQQLRAYIERMPAAAGRLAGASLECRDALEVIAEYGVHTTTTIYADPPYVRTSRNSTGYRHEMGADDDHERLAETLHACRASVVLSGYHSPLYDRMYAGWHVTELKAWTTQGGAPGADIDRVEVLWSNVPLGADRLW